MRRAVMLWFGAWFVFFFGFVLSQIGCALDAEDRSQWPGVSAPANSQGSSGAASAHQPLRILPMTQEPENAPRIVAGDAYACLSTYEIANPNDDAGYVAKLVISAQPSAAFETVAVEWAGDDAKLPRAALPEPSGLVRVEYPNVGVRIAPRSSRFVRLCVVLKPVTTTSGTRISVALVTAEELDGGRVKFVGEDEHPRHVLRVSFPTITITPIAATPLRAGIIPIFDWTMEADEAGPIAVKQFSFHVDVADAAICSVRLHDDSEEEFPDHDIVELTDKRTSSRSIRTACLDHAADIAIVFRDEYRLMAGAGVRFTLFADVKSVRESAKIETRFLRTADVITDTINCGDLGFASFLSDPTMASGLIWSDVSAHPHSAASCYSSRDWIGDALVTGLEGARTYSF